jgi:hypothetical protein
MTVAAMAYEKLTSKAREQATALLKLNPNYDQRVARVPEQDRNRVAFIMAATNQTKYTKRCFMFPAFAPWSPLT